jgi:ribosomal protein S18 acetylase RimI-like enzyme
MKYFQHKLANIDEIEIAFKLLKDAAIWLKEKKIDYWQDWINPPDNFKNWIRNGFKNKEFFFVYTNDELIGMYRLQFSDDTFWGKQNKRAGYIHSFTTKRESYKKGFGYKILQEMETILKADNIEFLRLDCGINVKGLCQYYEKYGFVSVGETTIYGENLRLYEKKIN